MPNIGISDSDKREFDDRKPDDYTQAEFTSELLDAHRRDDGEVVDVDALVDAVTKQTAAEVELAAYRGVSQALAEIGVDVEES